jgi:hypothetical protein
MSESENDITIAERFELLQKLLALPSSGGEAQMFHAPVILAQEPIDPTKIRAIQTIHVSSGKVTITPKKEASRQDVYPGSHAINKLMELGYELKVLAIVALPLNPGGYRDTVYHDVMAVLVLPKVYEED